MRDLFLLCRITSRIYILTITRVDANGSKYMRDGNVLVRDSWWVNI